MTPPASADDTTTPLGPDDFDAQDAVLDALREHDENVPAWEYCEGFLAALICTRRAVEPDEYWPVLLGPGFRPMEQMEFVWRWKRRWAEVQGALDAPVESLDDPRTYHPEVLDTRGALLALPDDQRSPDTPSPDDVPSFAQAWAVGFLDAVEVWAEDWQSPRDAELAAMLDDALDCIAALAADDTGKPTISMHDENGPPSVSQQRADDFAEAIWAVYDLRQLWKSLGPRTAPLRKDAAPGRNDACPCGSGKKYKKCHGAG